MAHVIGTVKSIHGKAAVKKVDGQLIVLKVGDVLHANEMVYALGADSTVTLSLEGGRTLNLNGYDEILLDSSVFATLEKGESLDVDALRQAIADGLNPEKAGETAAGSDAVSESNAGADFAIRADGRGNVSSYLTGTESNALGVPVVPENLLDQTVILENNAPIAVADTATTEEDTPVTINVLINDMIPNALNVTTLRVNGSTYKAGDTALQEWYAHHQRRWYTTLFTHLADWNGPLPQSAYAVIAALQAQWP